MFITIRDRAQPSRTKRKRALRSVGRYGMFPLRECGIPAKLFGSASKEMFAYYKALADSSEQCRSTSTICWVPPDPEEVYTKARIQAIDAAVNAAKKKMSGVTADQKKRMENQFAYWSNAKAICL